MIFGDGIRFRAPERSDLEMFVAWLNDPEVRFGLSLSLPLSMGEEEKWYQSMLERPSAEHPMVIEIQEGETWRPIGNCGFHAIDWRSRSSEVGIFIGEKSLWNQGYGSAAMRLLLKIGFETINLNRIFLRVHADNPRAIRSYEKVGFVHEGGFRQAEFKDGKFIDVLFMSVLRSEWHG